MGSVRRALCTGVLAATALTPAAHAADGADGVPVTPATPAPGTDVTLEVAERTAVAVSSAFVSEVRLTVADGVLTGESRVRSTLTAGTYSVRVDCGKSARQGAITVAPAASPVAPVDAGGGGTARTVAADESGEGPGTAQTTTGLFLAAAATAAVVRSRVRQNRGTH
ncbi:hypothetical protein ABZ892_02725 [Streptomyces sp. NPDC046924]|uniref:hypothetical protein n=1 Tax=Streptomyces sp. NPDC046924 TaxID=3155136 RepID=UPI0034073FD0